MKAGRQLFTPPQPEQDMNARIRSVVILEFRVCERRAVFDRPVNRLQVAIHKAFFSEPGEHLQNGPLVLRSHREVRGFVGANGPQPLELFGLEVHAGGGVVMTPPPDL